MSFAGNALRRAQDLARIRFLRFLVVGAMNTVFGYVVFWLALTMLGNDALAALVSTIAGIAFNFRSTGILVFDSRDSSLLARFVATNAAVYAVDVLGLRGLALYGLTPALAQALLTPFLAVLSYILARDFVFDRKRPSP